MVVRVVSAYRVRRCGTPSIARTVNAIQARQRLTTLSSLNKGMLFIRTSRTGRVSHHTQAFDVIKDPTAMFNIPRGNLIGKPVRIPFHKIPIPGSQASAPSRGTGGVSSNGHTGHTKGQNVVTQVRVKGLIK